MKRRTWTILDYAFRPFFLLGGAFAVAAILAWVLALHGIAGIGQPDAASWHAHEMLFGFGGAAIGGFLLTAVATWTGRPPVAGPPLGALVVAWLAGRLAMASSLPAPAVALLDLAFPLLMAAITAREIIAGRSRRNFGIAAGVTLLAALDALFHLGRTGAWPGADRVALLLTAHGLALLVTVVGGRIIPSFTANWLRLRGDARLPRAWPWLERLVLAATALAGLADSLGAPAPVAAASAMAAAAAHAARLAAWRGPATAREPLLAVLHVAYAWLPAAYALLGLTALGLPLPHSAALHALTMGGVGSMVLAVSTRVALGHTGRPLVAAPLTVAAYAVLNVAVVARIAGPLSAGAAMAWVDAAAAGWIVAFGLFLWVYGPILWKPRADGRPGRSAPN